MGRSRSIEGYLSGTAKKLARWNRELQERKEARELLDGIGLLGAPPLCCGHCGHEKSEHLQRYGVLGSVACTAVREDGSFCLCII